MSRDRRIAVVCETKGKYFSIRTDPKQKITFIFIVYCWFERVTFDEISYLNKGLSLPLSLFFEK